MELFAHVIIDKGAMVCPKCSEIISSGIFCSVCGYQVGPEFIPCQNDECMRMHPDPEDKIVYCDMCGWLLGESDFEKKMISGEIGPDDINIEPMDRELVNRLFDHVVSDDGDYDEMVI